METSAIGLGHSNGKQLWLCAWKRGSKYLMPSALTCRTIKKKKEASSDESAMWKCGPKLREIMLRTILPCGSSFGKNMLVVNETITSGEQRQTVQGTTTTTTPLFFWSSFLSLHLPTYLMERGVAPGSTGYRPEYHTLYRLTVLTLALVEFNCSLPPSPFTRVIR